MSVRENHPMREMRDGAEGEKIEGLPLPAPRLAFLGWGNFQVRSRFVRSAISEGK